MALIKKTEIDRIELVGADRVMQVREATWIEDDETGEVFGRQYHRKVIQPGDDVAAETADIRTIAQGLYTAQRVANYRAKLTERAERLDRNE